MKAAFLVNHSSPLAHTVRNYAVGGTTLVPHKHLTVCTQLQTLMKWMLVIFHLYTAITFQYLNISLCKEFSIKRKKYNKSASFKYIKISMLLIILVGLPPKAKKPAREKKHYTYRSLYWRNFSNLVPDMDRIKYNWRNSPPWPSRRMDPVIAKLSVTISAFLFLYCVAALSYFIYAE